MFIDAAGLGEGDENDAEEFTCVPTSTNNI